MGSDNQLAHFRMTIRMVLIIWIGLLLSGLVYIYQPEFFPVPPQMTSQEWNAAIEKSEQELASELGGGHVLIDFIHYPDWGFTLRFYHPGQRHRSRQQILLWEIIALFTMTGILRESIKYRKTKPEQVIQPPR